MAELERDLRALAAYVDFPGERDLRPGIEARLAQRPPRRWVRVVAIAVVAAAVAIGIAFAVPPARSAILRFFGLEGVTIARVDKLPVVDVKPAVIGVPTTLDEAAQVLGFKPALPDIGTPRAVYLDPSQQAVLLVYGKPLRLRLEETKLRVFQKFVTFGAPVQRVRVNRSPGVWIPASHVVDDFFSQPRLSGSALIWELDDTTLRLEGKLTKDEALRIARSIHAVRS
jgi:hypothetical protein